MSVEVDGEHRLQTIMSLALRSEIGPGRRWTKRDPGAAFH